MADTIFAVSSGPPPAAIAIIRISGPEAGNALSALAGELPKARTAALRWLRASDDSVPLDHALILWFPGPATVTGEDLAELHCHGGRAVIAALLSALDAMPGLRPALPGEFTRRAFENGRLDLSEAEGLADLLQAETETQRRAALAMTEGHFSRKVSQWQAELLRLSAMTEAALDFSDEDDVPDAGIESIIRKDIAALVTAIAKELARPTAERLRDGIRVVLAGPPNAGKSTLLNALVQREAAIVSDIAGTTRDRIDVPAAIGGVAFLFTDTAGLRDETDDRIEAVGIDRARHAMADADIILWLGDASELPRPDAIQLAPQSDIIAQDRPGLLLSARTGEGMNMLTDMLLERAATMLPRDGDYALGERQRKAVATLHAALSQATEQNDMLLVAEQLRLGRAAVDALTGRASTDDMLDALFGTFCIGK